ncbi:MAG: hypothetical protein H6626_07560 [Pseudobdellovibrionaceae bacterium]|nr:MAG: hypothetical protein H6626_07560 [Pseudobdellovibrionaceae bacterium]
MKNFLVHPKCLSSPNPNLIRTFAGLFLLTVATQSQASVDYQSGSFTESSSDFGIERTYSSRSLFVGVFGFGWCSRLDTYIELSPDIKPQLNRCGKPVNGAVMTANAQGFLYTDNNQFKFQFTTKGHLKNVKDSEGNTFRMLRDPDLDRVMEIQWQSQVRKFTYKNDLLLGVTDSSMETTQYKYDLYNNLTEVIRADESQLRLTYDLVHDRLIEIQDPKTQCREVLEYHRGGSDHHFVDRKKMCHSHPISQSRHEYWYKLDGSKSRTLSKSRVQHGTELIETIYDVRVGLPQRVSLIGGELGVSVAFDRAGQISGILSSQPGRELEAAARLLKMINL